MREVQRNVPAPERTTRSLAGFEDGNESDAEDWDQEELNLSKMQDLHASPQRNWVRLEEEFSLTSWSSSGSTMPGSVPNACGSSSSAAKMIAAQESTQKQMRQDHLARREENKDSLELGNVPDGWSSLNSSWDTGISDCSSLRSEVWGWSKGSELHAAGSCKPCLFLNVSFGCRSGADCDYCHLEHADRNGKSTKRKKKKKELKKLAEDEAKAESVPSKAPLGKFSL